MKKEFAKEFWLTLLQDIKRFPPQYPMTGPKKKLIELKAMPQFETRPLDEQAEIVGNYADAAEFWKNQNRAEMRDILYEALRRTELSELTLQNIAALLALASEKTTYRAPGTPVDLRSAEDANLDLDADDWYVPDIDEDLPFEDAPRVSPKKWTPREIYEYLEKHIIGQEEAKRVCSMLVYNHIHNRPRNIVLAGPTGSGKTEIWRCLAKKFDFIRIINSPQLACDGWKGSFHLKDIFLEERTPDHLLLVFDEFDKMLEPQIASGGTDYSKMMQNELLKLFDGDKVEYIDDSRNRSRGCVVDGSTLSFVLCGSFERMIDSKTESQTSIGFGAALTADVKIQECTMQDLIDYANMRLEIAGRVNQIVILNPMTVEDFENILLSPTASPVKKIEEAHGIRITLDRATRHEIAEAAAASGMGCRYSRSILQQRLDRLMFDCPNSKTYDLSNPDHPDTPRESVA